jgi:hypothetical protein
MPMITSEYEDTSIPPLDEGIYRATVKKIALQAKKAGKEYASVRIDYKVVVPMDQASKASADGTYSLVEFISLHPKAGWKLEEFLVGCGAENGKGFTKEGPKGSERLMWDSDLFIDKETLLTLSQSQETDGNGQPKPGGRIRNQVEAHGPVA